MRARFETYAGRMTESKLVGILQRHPSKGRVVMRHMDFASLLGSLKGKRTYTTEPEKADRWAAPGDTGITITVNRRRVGVGLDGGLPPGFLRLERI